MIEVLNINSSDESIIKLLQEIRQTSITTNEDVNGNIDDDDGGDSTLVEESNHLGDANIFVTEGRQQTVKKKPADDFDKNISIIDQWSEILNPVKQKSEAKALEVSEGNNLEVSVIKHQNSILRSEVEKLTKNLEMVLGQQNELLRENMALRKEITSLKKELNARTSELEADQNVFKMETNTIKREVTGALGKLEQLKKDLEGSEKEKEGMSTTCKEKEQEIERLNLVNKHLRGSVTRLLQDLESTNVSKFERNKKMSHMLLHHLDDVIKFPPPPTSKEGEACVDGGVGPEVANHTIRTIYRNIDVITPTTVGEVAGSSQIAVASDCDVTSSEDDSFRPLARMSSCSGDDVMSVGVSDVSMTSSTFIAERNFNEELVSLDENIAKLQENLRSLQNEVDI